MRFIVDQSLPDLLVEFIRDEGHEADHPRALGLAQTPDADIVRLAARDRAVIISKDQDFSLLLSRSALDVRTIWIRLGNCGNRELMSRFEAAWDGMLVQLRFGVRVVELR